MKFLVWVAAIVFALPASADFKVVDEGNVIGKLRTWFNPQPFERVMVCGQSSTVEATAERCRLECSDLRCKTFCEAYGTPTGKGRYDAHIDECSTDLAHLFADNGLIVPVTRQEFEDGAGTYLIPFLRAMGKYIEPEGEVHLTWMIPTSTEYIENGELTRLSAYIVEGEIRFENVAQMVHFRIVLTDQLTGPKQLLLFELDRDDYFWKTRGLVGEFRP